MGLGCSFFSDQVERIDWGNLFRRRLRLDRNCPSTERIDRPYVERQRAAVGGEINRVAGEQLDRAIRGDRVTIACVNERRAGRSDKLVRHGSLVADRSGHRCVVEESGERNCVQYVHALDTLQSRYQMAVLLKSMT